MSPNGALENLIKRYFYSYLEFFFFLLALEIFIDELSSEYTIIDLTTEILKVAEKIDFYELHDI